MTLHNATTAEVGTYQLRVRQDMVIGEVLQLLRKQAGPSWDGKPLRMLRLRDSEIYKVLGCLNLFNLQHVELCIALRIQPQ